VLTVCADGVLDWGRVQPPTLLRWMTKRGQDTTTTTAYLYGFLPDPRDRTPALLRHLPSSLSTLPPNGLV
jgi:hypothetical protein